MNSISILQPGKSIDLASSSDSLLVEIIVLSPVNFSFLLLLFVTAEFYLALIENLYPQCLFLNAFVQTLVNF